MNKKIIMSMSVIIAAAAVVIGGTSAFFSDTETSTGNTFTAGAIDLSLGGGFSSVNNGGGGLLALASDNAGRALYNFVDLKPGDTGGGSFNLQVTSNDAYVCAKSTITATPEGLATEPEVTAGDSASDPVGELQNYLQFATFDDDNENGVYDAASEPINVGQYIPAHDTNGFTAAEISGAGWVPVADTSFPNTWLVATTLPSNTLQGAGMLYCFGNFTTTGSGSTTQVTGCDGTDTSGTQNRAQTDGVVGSIEFSAVQTRNNPGFTCASMNPQPVITRVDRTQTGLGDGGWAGWSCPVGTTAVGGGIDSFTNPVGGNGFAAPSSPVVDGFTYPIYPHYTFTADTGYVVHDLVDGLGNTISFHIDCQVN